MTMSRLLALCLLLTATALVPAAENPPLKSGVFSPPRQAPDFTLQGSDGTELHLGRYHGRVVVLAFGFTHCTDVCPTTLAVLAQARKTLVADGADFQVVYITVDPERDDAERMRQYLADFDATFIGGTGTAGQL
jgi:protein SCO1/2